MINLIHLGMLLLCSSAFEKCAAEVYFDAYVRAVEGDITTIACTGGNVIVFERITYGDNYRIELLSCSDLNAAQALAPYCQFKQTCTVTIDRTLFADSTCAASITEYFQARYFCRLPTCEINYCSNGGSCVLSNSVASCNCFGDWTGTNCDVSPCVNTTCPAGQTCLVDFATGTAVCDGCNGDITTAASGTCTTDFGYYPDPDNCAGFIQCNWGVPTRKPCGNETIWSQPLMTCITGTC